MKYYVDITLLPDAETDLGFLWQKVYQQVHIALADNKVAEHESAIAISIAEYKEKDFPLGAKLRLLADDESKLITLHIEKWLSRLSDYCRISSIEPVPTEVEKYVCFKQKRIKGEGRIESQLVRKAKHISKKFDVDYEQCLAELKGKTKYVKSTLPYIQLESQQTKQRTGDVSLSKFKLFIEREFVNTPKEGIFDCYGLSKTATLPWF